MKRVAVYLDIAPEGGGSFQYARDILAALAGFDQSSITIRVWYTHALWLPILRVLGLEGRQLASPKGLQRICNGLMRRLGRMLPPQACGYIFSRTYPHAAVMAWDPDIVVCPHMVSLFITPGTKQVCAIHDLMHIYEPTFPEVGEAKELAARKILFSDLTRNASDILVDSPLGKQHVLENYTVDPDQVHILPFRPPKALLQAVPTAPATPLPEKFIYYPAQFWPHKNHGRLLEAIASVRTDLPDIHCVLTGSTKYDGFVKAREVISALGLESQVSILGYVATEEASWLYRNARCLVMPTFFGPTNIPPLEAMALGCPVAVSDIYAMRWQCGDAAVYFKPDSVEAIAETLRTLWIDDSVCARLQQKGLERSSAWTEDNFITTLHSILKNLCGE